MASESPLKSTCILQSCLNCGGSNTPLITAGPERLCSIVKASKCRGDGLHLDLEPMVHDGGSSTLLLHENRVSTYTSNTHITRFLSRQNRTTDEPVVQRTCSSDISPFNFKEHCLICEEKCCPKPDPNIQNAGDVLFNVEQLIEGPIKAHSKMSSLVHLIYVMMIGGSKFACELKVQSVTYMLLMPSTTKTACRHLEVLVTSIHL